MTQEYWTIKEQFGFLRNIAKYMDCLREIRTLYPNTENMTLKEVEDWLNNRYVEMDTKLAKDLNLRDETPSETWEKLIKKVEVKRKRSKGRKV